MELVGPVVVVFVQLEVRQGLRPTPLVVPSDVCPLLVVTGLTAHVNHAVDAGATAQHFAARITQSATVQTRRRLGLVQPVGARIANAIQVAHRNVNPVVIVFFTRFDQQHALAGVCTQAVGQQTASSAAANDDVVEGVVVHGCPGLLMDRLCLWILNQFHGRSVHMPGCHFAPMGWHKATDEGQRASAAHGCATATAPLIRRPYLAVGITNSAPLPMLSGQRCMMDFCLV